MNVAPAGRQRDQQSCRARIVLKSGRGLKKCAESIRYLSVKCGGDAGDHLVESVHYTGCQWIIVIGRIILNCHQLTFKSRRPLECGEYRRQIGCKLTERRRETVGDASDWIRLARAGRLE